MRTTTTTLDRAAVVVAVAGLALGLGTGLSGCGSWFGGTKGEQAAAAGGTEPRVGLTQLEAGEETAPRGAGAIEPSAQDELAARAAASASELERLFEQQRATQASTPEPGENPYMRTIPEDAGASVRVERVPEPVPVVAEAPPLAVPAAPVETPAQRVARLSAELGEALRERTGSPFVSAAAGTMLAAVEPLAAAPSTIELTPAEQRAIGALRLAAEGFVSGRASSGETSDAAAVLNLALTSLETDGRVRIAEAALCARVMGFGQWSALGTSSFLAGRATPMIVYTELGGFGSRVATEAEARRAGMEPRGDLRAADLDVTLALYHAADGVLAWKRPTERVVDVSRRDRRDFYVLAEIELPPSLTIGAYSLKVRVQDRVNGSEDEAILPISIVGDASALTGASTD